MATSTRTGTHSFSDNSNHLQVKTVSELWLYVPDRCLRWGLNDCFAILDFATPRMQTQETPPYFLPLTSHFPSHPMSNKALFQKLVLDERKRLEELEEALTQTRAERLKAERRVAKASRDEKALLAQKTSSMERIHGYSESFGILGRKTFPADILRSIMEAAIGDDTEVPLTLFCVGREDMHTPFLLAGVSTRWRNIALSTPQLWTRICVHESEFDPPSPARNKADCDYIGTILDRSKAASLDINIHISTSLSDCIIQRILENGFRWRQARVGLFSERRAGFAELLSRPLLRLERLKLTATAIRGTTAESAIGNSIRLFAPQLREFILWLDGNVKIEAQFPTIQHLRYVGAMDPIFHLLMASPRCAHVILHVNGDEPPRQIASTTKKSLRMVSLDLAGNQAPGVMASFLGAFSVPHLQKMILGRLSGFGTHFHSLARQLRTLEIKPGSKRLGVQDAIVLAELTSLQSLWFCGVVWDATFFLDLTDHRPWRLPCLTNVVFHYECIYRVKQKISASAARSAFSWMQGRQSAALGGGEGAPARFAKIALEYEEDAGPYKELEYWMPQITELLKSDATSGRRNR